MQATTTFARFSKYYLKDGFIVVMMTIIFLTLKVARAALEAKH